MEFAWPRVGKKQPVGKGCSPSGSSIILVGLHTLVQALWETPVPRGTWRYYDGLLYLQALLHVSGNFQAYAPIISAVTFLRRFMRKNRDDATLIGG